MKTEWILLLIVIFIVQIYLAIKAYIKANFGKQKSEVKEINHYIFFTIGCTVIILLDLIIL